MIKTCEYCQIEFETKSHKAKYCSDAHKMAARRESKLDKKDGIKNNLPQNNIEVKTKAQTQNQTKTKNKLHEYLASKGVPITQGSDLPDLEFISSGFAEIDSLTGGFPRNRITEIFGMKGVGKTALMSRMLQTELKTLYIDTENALVGVSPNIEVVHEYLLEDVADIVEVALDSGAYDLIVVDSVASMTSRAELEGTTGDAFMGLKARIMGQWMRKINRPLHNSNVALVFINQQRESLNPYGPAKFTPGGHALPYAASLRLELKTTKADRIVKDKEVVGHWVNVEVEKSRVCKPYQKARFKLMYT